VGFSAGMVICGENILTTNDKNDCGSTKFTGFGFTEYNFVAHYPAGDREVQVQRDSQICQYHNSHANPVLALEDDGCVEIDREGAKVVRGHCWLFELGKEKILLDQGYIS
jgi:peptidase E